MKESVYKITRHIGITFGALVGTLFLATSNVSGQNIGVEASLEKLMVKYETKVLQVYQEMQALEESPLSRNERVAFDSLLSAYTARVLEMYKTLSRLKSFTLENYRSIAARALIFRALAFIETATPTNGNIDRACSDYRQALILSRDNKIPVINQSLPYEIWIGERLYTRLADLLDDKDKKMALLHCMKSR